MLIDGNSLLYRAFYALPLLHNSAGTYTNGVYGFLTMFNRIIAEQEPSHILVAFDKDKKTFRSDIYPDYKANRSSPPDELRGQFQLLRDVLTALNVNYIELAGYEADDLIGTFSKKASQDNYETLILTGDRDTLQLVADNVAVLMTKKGISETQLYTPKEIAEEWEVKPEQMIEVKALMGDTADNIPGVPGIGIKTAVKLVKEFGHLENIYENLESVRGKKLKERLIEHREQAFLSRQLSTIASDIDLENKIDEFIVKEPDYVRLISLYRELEFNNLLKSLEAKTDIKLSTDQTLKDPESIIIKTPSEMKKLTESIKNEEKCSFLLECDYHHPMWGNLQGIYLQVGDKNYYIEIGENTNYLDMLKELLELETINKYTHNAKFAQVLLLRHGIKLAGLQGDTLLLAYVDDPAFAGEELSALFSKYMQIEIASDNLALKVRHMEDLHKKMLARIPKELKKLYREIELPLSFVLGYMEFYGVKIDKGILNNISTELGSGIEAAENSIYALAGSEFNINSPKQLGQVLFEDLGLRVIKRTKTGYGTGVEVLEQLYDEHPIIAYILNYRQLAKLKSTYVDAFTELIHPDTGRIHTIFKQAQTATGRLSSVEPNLQNIPIKMEEGRRIRKAFTVQEESNIIVSADYSQIDLRSLAHISGDQVLIDTFKKGIDIHTLTASEIFHVDLPEVDEELRQRAKAVNFGIIYGISDFGLARDTGVSRAEAGRYIENYLDTYPGVRKYMDDIVEFGKRFGYVETLLKRRRYLPELRARNRNVQSYGRRMALNTPIQGTSADIIKIAMLKIWTDLSERNLKARMLLQVHDDLILELPQSELEEVCNIIKDNMENAIELSVPLEVSIQSGKNWYDLETIDI